MFLPFVWVWENHRRAAVWAQSSSGRDDGVQEALSWHPMGSLDLDRGDVGLTEIVCEEDRDGHALVQARAACGHALQ